MEELHRRWDSLSGRIVRVEQAVPASPAEVCLAWLSPDRLAQWWWPQISDTTYEVDAREGGGFRFHSASAGFGARGSYLHLGPEAAPEIWMTWIWEGGDEDGELTEAPEEVVRVRFEELPDFGTKVVLEHKLAHPEFDTENPRQGWTDTMARLG